MNQNKLGDDIIKELVEFVHKGSIDKMIQYYENAIKDRKDNNEIECSNIFEKDLEEVKDYKKRNPR